MSSSAVIWHDLECGGYREDAGLWLQLAAGRDGPVLDIGAGTGRVSLMLARAGHEVVALDHDPGLLAELRRRAAGLAVEAVAADARSFDLGRRFWLIIVPMQTIQLLGGPAGRARFLGAARAHLFSKGLLAVALAEELEGFTAGPGEPLPTADECRLGDVHYRSQPTAIHAEPGAFVLERRREVLPPAGPVSVSSDRVRLDALSAATLEREAAQAGLSPAGRHQIPGTEAYAGSRVVMLGG